MRVIFLIFSILISTTPNAQTIGGSTAFNFIKLPASPLLTALGGVNVSYKTDEVGHSVNNPALLHSQLSSQLNTSFNSFLGGIKAYSLSGAYQTEKLPATLGGQIYFVDYGSILQTDAAGNISGDFRPVDFVVQASASKTYLEKWSYGVSIKFIQSSYQQYKSNAVAFDVGILYHDSIANFSAGIVAKNMGFQLKKYNAESEELPFDLQVGITKRLDKAPFGFSFSVQHAHQFNISYSDTTFNRDNNFASTNTGFNKIFNHFVLATHIYLGNNLEAAIGYNHLRRNELNTGSSANGLNGFSAGLRIKFSKLQILYARSSYQKNISYNQFGISVQLNKLVGL